MSGHSKGSRGLSVLHRLSGIFTGTTTSPRWLLRQCEDRYTIRAGRNLPDKEFRYLRTVIVTADIHQDLGSEMCIRDRLTGRYTIRAGRNLPDKEFRYLRTVIVTADIHRDLGALR